MSKIKIFLGKLYYKFPVLLYDALAIPFAWYGAFWFRYNLRPFSFSYSLSALLVVFAVQISCFYGLKIYRGVWRFFSMDDLIRILQAVWGGTVLVVPPLFLFSLLKDIPRTILPLYSLILIALLCMGRLTRRLLRESHMYRSNKQDSKRILIIGAGRAGESLVRDLRRDALYCPIGFIDDNPARKGLEIHGVAVLGRVEQLSEVVNKNKIELIFIAIPSADSAEMRRIVGYCEQCNIPFRTLPSISALVSGKVKVEALREVRIEDLLGRDQVHLQWNKIAEEIAGKRILVTGGGGSIGSELCRQVMALQPASLLIIDNCEFNLYNIQMELQKKFPTISLQIALLSVTDFSGITACLEGFSPQIVFHAAAYKHVPLLEGQTRIGVLNNVIGTQIVAEVSARLHVEKFILISTDKAVNPSNIMGTTKRVAEIFCQNMNNFVETQFITVRFGNVLGSIGSVVPLFQKQINAGGPVTVTHPAMTRYFMTIPEACQLILQAMVNGQGGEIFVLDMGSPVKITYLAEQLIKLSGYEPYKDIQIEFTGLRPGEKLYEELFHESEHLVATDHEKLFKARVRQFDWGELVETFHLLNLACNNHQEEEICILLNSLVPESLACQNLLQQTSTSSIVSQTLHHD